MSAKYMMLSGLILASAANAKEENFPAIDVSLAPKPVEANGSAIGSVDITLHFKGIDSNPNTPLVQLSMVADNVDTVATTLTALSARDDLGVVPLTVADVDLPVEAANDSEAGGLTRQWLPTRRTAGDVIVRYTVPARQTLPLRGAAPPTGFSDDSDAISASGHVLLLMPPGSRRYNATVSWDLSALPSGSRGISSFGEGKAASIEPVSANELRMSYFMSGKIGAWPEHIPPKGFFSAWQGTPPFDPQEVMRWTGTLYNHYVNFFNEKAAPPYGVFMRYNPINPGGGTGLYHSFIITFWKNAGEGKLAEFETTLAHEMYHTFQPYIVNPAGKESSWFTEGLAVFYESRLPLHFGLMKPQDFLNNINFAAARYYSSVMAGLPNDQIAPRFWSDTRVRTLVYDRGMLYFATVDDEVRKVSGRTRRTGSPVAIGPSGSATYSGGGTAGSGGGTGGVL